MANRVGGYLALALSALLVLCGAAPSLGGSRVPDPQHVPAVIRQPAALEVKAIEELRWKADKASPLDGEGWLRQRLDLVERTYGPNHPYAIEALGDLASNLQSQLRDDEGLALRLEALKRVEISRGPDAPELFEILGSIIENLISRARYLEARPFITRQISIAGLHWAGEHREQWARERQVTNEKEIAGQREMAVVGEEEHYARERARAFDPFGGSPAVLERNGQWTAAEGRWKALLSRRDLPDHLRGGARQGLLDNLVAQKKYSEAVPLAKEILDGVEAHAATIDDGGGWAESALGNVAYARVLRLAGRSREAVELLEPICADTVKRLKMLPPIQQYGPYTIDTMVRARPCQTELALNMAVLRSPGLRPDGAQPLDDRLAASFLNAQPALNSAADTALRRAAARAAAADAGLAQLDADLDDASAEKTRLSMAASAEIDPSTGAALANGRLAAERRETFRRQIAETDAHSAWVIGELKTRFPRYWALRSPDPVSIAELKSGLLKPGEVLVVWFLPLDETERGLVYAVSQSDAASAVIPLSGRELDTRIQALRRELDPCGSVGGAACGTAPTHFSRGRAFELYNALLGDPAIQRVIDTADSLLIVPSGALGLLPPAVLVSEAPMDGTEGDYDAQSLRDTAWLIKRYSVSVLPSVQSFKMLRTEARRRPSPRLFAVAEPDFSGRGLTGRSGSPEGIGRSGRYLKNGLPIRSAVEKLPGLPGAQREAMLVKSLFAPKDTEVLLYSEATEKAVRQASQSNRLAAATVVLFATHGILAGEMSSDEPGLALAGTSDADTSNDGFLSASEILGLRLDADLVILSACNTAGPEARTNQALSGLARAFFYAGARSLLVTQWRLRDDVAAAMVFDVVQGTQTRFAGNRAKALQYATLRVMDGAPHADTTMSPEERDTLAHPSAWAAFTLVGLPD